jgi:uncharacterized membrane protein SpoIIM required for sporulation
MTFPAISSPPRNQRAQQWDELDRLCSRLEGGGRTGFKGPDAARFATLYRAACADLAVADKLQLPILTVEYLHALVGRAHNQFYRSRSFRVHDWSRELFEVVPRRLYRDASLRLAFFLFWGVFILSMALAMRSRSFALEMLTEEGVNQLEESFSDPIEGREFEMNSLMAAFYIQHNTSIGLRCFAAGLLFGVGGLFATTYNAAALGASFGYMAASPHRDNFYHFVTAHGPFELTAIVISAGAGMKLGFSLVDTKGLTRLASLRKTAHETMPTMGAAMALFFFAALIEGFHSPSGIDYQFKAMTSVLFSGLLIIYFVVLGRAPASKHAA